MKNEDRSTITSAKWSVIIVQTAVTLSFLFPNRILVLFGYPWSILAMFKKSWIHPQSEGKTGIV